MNKEAWDRMAALEEEAEFMYGPGCWMIGARKGGGPKKVACANCGATHTELITHHEKPHCRLIAECHLRKKMKEIK